MLPISGVRPGPVCTLWFVRQTGFKTSGLSLLCPKPVEMSFEVHSDNAFGFTCTLSMATSGQGFVYPMHKLACYNNCCTAVLCMSQHTS